MYQALAGKQWNNLPDEIRTSAESLSIFSINLEKLQDFDEVATESEE